MKRLAYFIFACILPLGIHAQDIPSDSTNINKIDSLTQVVNESLAKLEKLEENERQEAIWDKRKKYFHIGYMNQTLTHQDIAGLKWKSDFGFSVGMGRTFYLHKKPLFNMLKFGLDVTWMDISYAKYSTPKEWEALYESTETEEGEEELDLGTHQIELGLHIGPSITVNPVSHLKASAYFHFIPSGSVIILNDEANASYVSNFAIGGAISYKSISLGIESRWGKAKYNSFSVDDESLDSDSEEDLAIDDVLIKSKNRMKTKSLRFYIIFRY